MKPTTKSAGAILLLSLIVLASCQKESAKPSSTTTTTPTVTVADITDVDAPGVYNNTPYAGYTKLVIQPGAEDGQDAWIDWNEYNSSYADANSGSIDQFKCLGWTDGGALIKSRTLIKFLGLSQIPSNSQVVAAKMYLYGLASSEIHLPQGNSYYPGSPYNDFGPNSIYVQRITSDWDENTVTWNTQPASTVKDESLISPSTKQWNYNASVDVTELTKPMVKTPPSNYGFLLQLVDETPYHSMGFCSSENADATKHPKLIIIYKN